MQVSPRYDEHVIIEIDGDPRDVLVPVTRQRRRFAATLRELRPDQWDAPSRCEGWRVQDVVAHLAGVDQFWAATVQLGRGGQPSRYLEGFDPVATPAQMVDQDRERSSEEILSKFVAASESFLSTLDGLSADEWTLVAEAPPGHLPIRLVATHALWDAWVHERDVTGPLGIASPVHGDEVSCALRYVVALNGAFALLANPDVRGVWDLHASDPDVALEVTVDGSAVVRSSASPSSPALCGDAVDLLETLSFRAPLADDAPPSWRNLLSGLATVFDQSSP